MRNNDQTNKFIKWSVIALDFILMNLVILPFFIWHPTMMTWPSDDRNFFFLACNLAMMVSEYNFHTIIHRRLTTSMDILRRVLGLTMLHAVIAYLILQLMDFEQPVVKVLLVFDTLMFVILVIVRVWERWAVKRRRMSGGNFRTVVFVGTDPELVGVYERLMNDPARGFRVLGYYGDKDVQLIIDSAATSDAHKPSIELPCLGSVDHLIKNWHSSKDIVLGDDMYVCLSRMDSMTIRVLSGICEQTVTRFFYVPVSVETIGLPLKRTMLDDIEIFSTYKNPLENPVSRVAKRLFDVLASSFALLCILPFLPIIAFMIKKQSPKGPVFFKQPRTGLDGKEFYCYKFRSMHPNKDESGLKQATKDDPRKFPFGNFMRKTSVDELPQFWNVLKGDMSIVGPRPHPVALNEKYKNLIDKYMVRHFVKPGVTGWAQVTGFRGETEALWQMEGRIKRDIWYMENWSFWLDLRILWLTARLIFVKDEQAY